MTDVQIVANTRTSLFAASPVPGEDGRPAEVSYMPVLAWVVRRGERDRTYYPVPLTADGEHEGVVFDRATGEWWDPSTQGGTGEAALIEHWRAMQTQGYPFYARHGQAAPLRHCASAQSDPSTGQPGGDR